MKTRIIVDSTTDLLPEIKEKVTIIPLTIYFGDEEYKDGITIDHKMFYEKLVETDVHPTTSQPSPVLFALEYEKEGEWKQAIRSFTQYLDQDDASTLQISASIRPPSPPCLDALSRIFRNTCRIR